jgi:hypothetical protein
VDNTAEQRRIARRWTWELASVSPLAKIAQGPSNTSSTRPMSVAAEPCGCRKPRPRSSCCVLVLVEDAAEAVVSADVETGDAYRIGDGGGQWV